MADIRRHSKTPVSFDAFAYHQDPSGRPNGWGWQPQDAFDASRMTNPHNGGSNYQFLDGHTQWLPPAQRPLYVAAEGLDYDGNGTMGSRSMLR
jgi:prepilin-type processing-associated H-X9-DG protein